VIKPILLLLSVLPKRTCVGFRKFADSFLAQRWPQRTWVDFKKYADSVFAQRLDFAQFY